MRLERDPSVVLRVEDAERLVDVVGGDDEYLAPLLDEAKQSIPL